jgi:hypothetical protein
MCSNCKEAVNDLLHLQTVSRKFVELQGVTSGKLCAISKEDMAKKQHAATSVVTTLFDALSSCSIFSYRLRVGGTLPVFKAVSKSCASRSSVYMRRTSSDVRPVSSCVRSVSSQIAPGVLTSCLNGVWLAQRRDGGSAMFSLPFIHSMT